MIDVHALGFVTVIKGGRTTDAYTSRPLYDDDDVCVCVCVCVQEGLVDFYKTGSGRRNGSSWPSLSTLCGCAFGAISVLTLGALLAQR